MEDVPGTPPNDEQQVPKLVVGDKVKHLELIQAIITRMATNSFMIKGWCLTLVAALLALAGGEKGRPSFAFVACVPLFMFWYLDAYFLRMERWFRDLYNHYRKEPGDKTDFSMNITLIGAPANAWKMQGPILKVMWSITLGIFYGLTLMAVVAALIILKGWHIALWRGLKPVFGG